MFKFIVFAMMIAAAVWAYPYLFAHSEFSAGLLFGIVLVCVWHRITHGYWPLDGRPICPPPDKAID